MNAVNERNNLKDRNEAAAVAELLVRSTAA